MSDRLNNNSGIHNVLGFEKLFSLFEHPPSFDDAEIVDMHFNRGNTLQCMNSANWEERKPPFLEVKFYLFDNMYSSNDPKANACYVVLEFIDIHKFNLSRFEHQNPICDFSITEMYNDKLKQNMFDVSWGGAGHEVEFLCAEIKYKGKEDIGQNV